MIDITGVGSEMQGVGRLPDGRAAFVPFAIPGENVEIEIVRARDRFVEARLLRVIGPSPDRVKPVCPHFGLCGGCQTQHMSYARALTLKRQKVYDALVRLGGLSSPEVSECVPSQKEFGYRNKAEYAALFSHAGMMEAASHRVIDLDECPLQAENANSVFRFVKEHMGTLPVKNIVPRVNSAGEMLLALSVDRKCDLMPLAWALRKEFPFLLGVYEVRLKNRPAHALDGEAKKMIGDQPFYETLCSLKFGVSPQSFFQVNRPQAERLYEIALGFASLTGKETVADIYCGAGTISLAAAKMCRHVTGIEIVPEAVRDARENAKINGLSDKTEFIAADAGEAYPRLHKAGAFDCVIVVPPRKGVDEGVLNALIKAPAPRIVYVSCNPATLARDVKILTSSGVYRFEKAVPVDMFPQTAHVETVVLLSREKADDNVCISVHTKDLQTNSN